MKKSKTLTASGTAVQEKANANMRPIDFKSVKRKEQASEGNQNKRS